jgi:hypothetical protein
LKSWLASCWNVGGDSLAGIRRHCHVVLPLAAIYCHLLPLTAISMALPAGRGHASLLVMKSIPLNSGTWIRTMVFRAAGTLFALQRDIRVSVPLGEIV